MNKREANKLAREIAKVNTAMWTAIGLAEDLMGHPVVHLLVNNYGGENNRLYEQLAVMPISLWKPARHTRYIPFPVKFLIITAFDYLETFQCREAI